MFEKNIILTKSYHSPCGDMILGEFDGKLCLCGWAGSPKAKSIGEKLKKVLKAEYREGTADILERAIRELDEFFAGGRTDFDIPLLFSGTDFQNTVWKRLLGIPYGSTVSYGELSRQIGHPAAARAVANSNARNPISVFVPCHRVIGCNNTLTGYGGGLDAKRFLIALERGNRK